MAEQSARDLRALGARFDLRGTFIDARRYGTGHINETWLASYTHAGRDTRYIHQRINGHVFRDPVGLMENVSRVLAHSAVRLAGTPDAARRTLTLVPSREGHPWAHDADGAVWRTYLFIERTRVFDIVETPAQAEAAARAFGAFQALLADLPGARLRDTIPDFHHTRKRFDALVAAVHADPCNRAHACGDLIAVAMAHECDVDRLQQAVAAGEVPERVAHNDTKINNVLMDADNGEELCVVDLDTTMPGLAPVDFGDMVRTATNAAAEDAADVTHVHAREDVFEALARGYLSSAGAFLEPREVDWLAFAGQLLAYEQAIRFLCDHLEGDPYYRIHHPGHNLQRARAQFALMQSIARQRDRFEAIVATYR